MSKPNKYKAGDHWVQCQRCATVNRSSRMKKEWTGLIVCGQCWEARHPQDFVRARPDRQLAGGLVNVETQDRFVDGSGYCSLTGVSGVAGFATAGCAVCGDDRA